MTTRPEIRALAGAVRRVGVREATRRGTGRYEGVVLQVSPLSVDVLTLDATLDDDDITIGGALQAALGDRGLLENDVLVLVETDSGAFVAVELLSDTPLAGVVGAPGAPGPAGADGPIGAAGADGGVLAALDDPFTTDLLANYTAHQGTSKTGLQVSGGALRMTDANDHSLHHSTLSVEDAAHLVQIVPGAISRYVVNLVVKYIDDLNFLILQVLYGASYIGVYQQVGGAYTDLAGTSIPSPAVTSGVPIWLVAKQSGKTLSCRTYTVNPMQGDVVPYSQGLCTLAGGGPGALGAGVAGKPGLRLGGWNGSSSANTTDWAIADWVVVTSVARTGF